MFNIDRVLEFVEGIERGCITFQYQDLFLDESHDYDYESRSDEFLFGLCEGKTKIFHRQKVELVNMVKNSWEGYYTDQEEVSAEAVVDAIVDAFNDDLINVIIARNYVTQTWTELWSGLFQ